MAESSSIAKLQKQSLVKRKSSVRKDEAEFGERQTDKLWQKSSSAANCSRCQKKFSLTTRKHHCRECGKVFCSKCSAFQIVVNGALKRVSSSKLYMPHLKSFSTFRLVEVVIKLRCTNMEQKSLLAKLFLLVRNECSAFGGV